ncbi:MAG: hypothetical protein EKK42_06515 [Pseudonocardiaceae bacterium]|nr:MAG: hypothetical protein EKK42_06515 [Pseudonocardiaceae bacterium]
MCGSCMDPAPRSRRPPQGPIGGYRLADVHRCRLRRWDPMTTTTTNDPPADPPHDPADDRTIHTSHLPWRLEFPGPRRATIREAGLGDSRAVSCRITPLHGVRSAAEVGRTRGDVVALMMVRGGSEYLHQYDRTSLVRPGQAVLWDGVCPMTCDTGEGVRKQTLFMPRDRLRARRRCGCWAGGSPPRSTRAPRTAPSPDSPRTSPPSWCSACWPGSTAGRATHDRCCWPASASSSTPTSPIPTCRSRSSPPPTRCRCATCTPCSPTPARPRRDTCAAGASSGPAS